MRPLLVIFALASLSLAGPAAAQQHASHGPLPEGWHARVDRGQPMDGVRFTEVDGGYRAVTGPAAVFYNPTWEESGTYAVSARFTQNRAPQHPESYGIVIGGNALDEADREYSYFLVRGTGEFFIATRKGDERIKVVDWTPHPSITKQDAGNGRQTNVLGVEVRGDEAIFTVNGAEVARQPKGEVETDGIFGFRINHKLDVTIDRVSR
jgi:hypothetical protein